MSVGPSPNDLLGFDVYVRRDMESNGRSATGIELVSNAIYHRLTTGLLPLIGSATGEEEYGEDVRTWCGGTLTPASAQARGPQASAIIQRDPRIDTVDVSVDLAGPASAYRMTMAITARTVTGQTISLVLGISEVTVDLLAQGR